MKIKKETKIVFIMYGIYLIFDYCNLPSILFNMSKINTSFHTNMITVLIFLTTYFLINKRDVDTKVNQRNTAISMLIYTYDACKEFPSLLEADEKFLKLTVSKCNFDKPMMEDKALTRLQDYPFDYHNMICEFAKSGIISSKEFADYLEVRKCYKNCIAMKITFFDVEASELPVKIVDITDLWKAIGKAKEHLSNQE